MKKTQITYIKNIILPCLVYSGITGIFTGVLIFLFKLCISKVIPFSAKLYALVRENTEYLPLLLLGAAALGVISALILRYAPDCKGGGIPTSVTLLRGLTTFSWVKSILLLFPSALVTYFGGVPLGTEGPAVQMGTAVGRGVVRTFVKRHLAWDRYIMTGGASAGFAAATGAPITGIFFAFEEAHRRFSPMLFMTAAVSAVASTAVMQYLCPLAGLSANLFHLSIDAVLPLKFIWASVIIGLACGFAGAVFTKIYSRVHSVSENIPMAVKTVAVFTLTALTGYFSADCIGTGDGLIEKLFEGHAAFRLLPLIFCIRGIFLIVANNIGITGGLFVPNLCFGAIIGGLCGKVMLLSGLLSEEYYIICVVMGIAAYLAASSRTPIMATLFSVECLSGLQNIIPIGLCVTIAYMTIETLGIHDFTDIVIESKLKKANKGKKDKVIDCKFTVTDDAFAVGKEIRDILWPPTCTVLAVHKKPSTHHHSHTGISEGDVLTLHYHTYNEEETYKNLESILGKQQ
ncbi:MAG: chloride channel protein [Acutalibacteraceae bacterium]|nr:chloride channel protein [Acutalibacteraceae bacterium]